ncbi:P-loop NTPase family protein [Tautonia rosea]|uniref:AAA family ATPase n=1 Tax=Tautonia rosea TaxID=2728037 RepID=UPI001475F87E|nr:AAA family ATPase [Tautonia rosea]
MSAGPSTLPSFESSDSRQFRPKVVTDFSSAGLNPALVESLVLKFLLGVGVSSGRRIADELGLPFGPFPDFLRGLKANQIVTYTDTAAANDYYFSLTDAGRSRARGYLEECAYVGTAPVPFADYLESVSAQTIAQEHPKEADLRRAFSDLLISESMFQVLGPAINSGKGMFLYGYPGNGKTSIAERITRCFGTTVWIPRTILVEGQILKLFDPTNHEPIEARRGGILRKDDQDDRWVEIRRPTIVAGGELTMDALEIYFDKDNKICEAPLQMKSNNGTFLIDDFGRQRMAPIELLNRWIVPLEKRYDYLRLPNGKQIQVPFDQLILFSTNLEPKDLVDEAFLRRIPYKINAVDPTEDMFRQMIRIFAPKLGFEVIDQEAVDYLIAQHYTRVNRPFRCCQPRDLLLQIRNYCIYNDLPLELKPEYFDFAAGNYFTVL